MCKRKYYFASTVLALVKDDQKVVITAPEAPFYYLWSIYRFHVYYHIRRVFKILKIPLPKGKSFNQYNKPYNHEKFIGTCSEYGVNNDLTKWRNQKHFSTGQSRAWETGKPGMSYINENSFSRCIIEKSDGLTMLGLQKLPETMRDYAYLVLTSQTSMGAPIVGHEARNSDAQ